eukprot:COSAG05_NODE_2924_length_2499_cov_1.503333_1_plen_174_part_00
MANGVMAGMKYMNDPECLPVIAMLVEKKAQIEQEQLQQQAQEEEQEQAQEEEQEQAQEKEQQQEEEEEEAAVDEMTTNIVTSLFTTIRMCGGIAGPAVGVNILETYSFRYAIPFWGIAMLCGGVLWTIQMLLSGAVTTELGLSCCCSSGGEREQWQQKQSGGYAQVPVSEESA